VTVSHLESSSATRQAGFRLSRFELYNWGTFHDRVWAIEPFGQNTLLTGDIGSGKSTLVDALTTLLVAPQKIAYNKAAGAESRERSLRSYVAGYFKSERGDAGFSAKPVALRNRKAYSVILAHFHADEIDQYVTLAQVFWQRESQGQPERLYAILEGRLTIGEHFSRLAEIRELRQRLRTVGAEVYDSFTSYGSAYRRRLGISDERAMDLFHQTVSMKSVGNLTDFVREHMLEAFDVEPRIRALITHFDDLNRAHDAVRLARERIERLEPLVADCDAFRTATGEIDEYTACRKALRPWFASLKAELLQRRIALLGTDIERQERWIVSLTTQYRAAETKLEQIREAILRNGGDRLESIRRDIETIAAQSTERERQCAEYDALAHALGLSSAIDEEHFVANRPALEREREALDIAQERTQAALTEATIVNRQLRVEIGEVESELASLRQRRSNIPMGMLHLRERLCQEGALDETTIPFAGELITVRSDASDWEGAAERVLRNFALSLLVPESLYGRVVEWVDRAYLRGRIVYYRVRSLRDVSSFGTADPDSLVSKLSIRPESPFFSWLTTELSKRFDLICCDDLDRFRREPRAVTRAGQIKGRGERHEKDDRSDIGDRSRYVLGWSNEAKISALEKQVLDVTVRLGESQHSIDGIVTQRKVAQSRVGTVERLAAIRHFRDIDWRSLVVAIDELESQRRELEEGSDILRTLEHQLSETRADMQRLESELRQRQGGLSVAQDKLEVARTTLAECEVVLDATPDEAKKCYFPTLESMRSEALGEHELSVESSDNRERDMRDWLQAKIDASIKRAERLRDAIVRAMQEYCGRYPADAQELDAAIGAASDYRMLLDRLRSDDLPRFEERFKELLNENAIREIANFQSQLYREVRSTEERIESINRSLHEIDYNSGRYILLESQRSVDTEIRDFQQDLRACTEGALTGSDDNRYAEAKFLNVRAIIERFRGREGMADVDRRWTRKVTDVRYWQTFSASERWREDNREHEHYTDSGGKSGGQKEKLAYTVLAASLAYQFGLERPSGRSFRFVAIDEAFGRGSDESTRYGLELFKKLDLQLLIVTPLQKIHVIEPFVSNVAFVHNDGRESQLRNLTIEEFRAQRTARIG
jgi:uncharacterized protein YPO0396